MSTQTKPSYIVGTKSEISQAVGSKLLAGDVILSELNPGAPDNSTNVLLGLEQAQAGGLPGVDEVTNSGHTWAIGGDSSPIPGSLPVDGEGSESLQESSGGRGGVRQGCGAWAVLAECESGLHHFAKRLFCGKEWCPDCGKHRSPAHNRRISRILPKVFQVETLGYLVIEWPDKYRKRLTWLYSKRALRGVSDNVINTLAGRRMGRRGRVGGYFKRGLVRWHWFGDKIPGKWNPHLNVLVDAAYIETQELEAIKAALREATNTPDLIVNYSYRQTPGEKFHSVEYITRATFTEYSWNPYMARALFNFRNMRWWGSWKGEPVWNLSQIEDSDTTGLLEASKLQQGICPDCGQPLKTIGHRHNGQSVQWTRPVDTTWLTIWGAQEIGNTGYYRIPQSEWHGGVLSPAEFMRLEQLERKARNNSTVRYVAVLARAKLKRKRSDDEWVNDG